MQLKNITLFLMIITLIVISCNSRRYVTDIPYIYSPQDKEFQDSLNWAQKRLDRINAGIVDDNAEGLPDDTLRIKEKYSILLGVMPKQIKNYAFYAYIDQWLGTPYKPNSLEEQVGVDCAYFVQSLYSEIYHVSLPKDPAGIFREKDILERFTGRTYLKEGDIIFLRYNKGLPISDLAIYLHNDKIVACTKAGLNIYNFNNEYFQLRYTSAGRLKDTHHK